MKYCTKCGQQLLDGDCYCPKCGTKVENNMNFYTNYSNNFDNGQCYNGQKRNTLQLIAMIFMIISCAWCGFLFLFNITINPNNLPSNYAFLVALGYLVPLFWALPMTIVYISKTKKKENVSTAFKVCSLLFVNFIAGILMLCDNQ